MALSITAMVWRLTLNATLFLQDVNNVFYFGDIDAVGQADDLAEVFESDTLPLILAVTSTRIMYNSINVEGVQVATDYFSNPVGTSGVVDNDTLPPFVAWSFRMNRASTTTRNGYKRFAGIPEDYILDNHPISGITTDLANLGLQMQANLAGALATYIPVIRTTQRAGDIVDPPEYNTFGSCVFVNVSTQNSRKVGHGS